MDHGQTHQASLSNSNNPHDRNRFRTFSDEHDEPSTVDRVEDYEIAAKSADYDIHGAMVKPQSNKRNRTDDSTDTDETITTSSSSSSATTVRFEGLFEGSGYDDDSSRLDQPPLTEGRSGNDVNSSLPDLRWIDRGRSFARPAAAAAADNHETADSTTADLHLVAADSPESSVESCDEDESNRDENSNIRDRRTVHGEKKNDSSEEESSESIDHRTYTDVAPSNSHLDTSYGGYEDAGVKRRSSSILEEKSVEELFDDNGWVITDQDLEKPARAVGSKKNGFEERASSNEEKRETGSGDRFEETNSGNVASQSLSRSGGGKYGGESSIGKNGWMVSDESESESERAVSPMENSTRRRNEVSIEEDGRLNRDGSSSTAEESGKGGIGAENDSWTGDENGWVILNKVNDSSNGKEGESVDETLSTIRSQTTDLVARTNVVENGALVANATQSKETESNCNEHEDTPGVDITIPMQMVTTVFCVSVLCYSVLINLFL